MSNNHIVETMHSTSGRSTMNSDTEKDGVVISAAPDSDDGEHLSDSPPGNNIPMKWKLTSILMVSMIGFGAHWSSGITGAMKSTIKKELGINNTQYAVLTASENFMVTALMLVSGVVTDRIGGAGTNTKMFILLDLLTSFRCNLLRKYHLHYWIHSYCWSCSN